MFTARDYGYTVISRFEEALRSYIASKLSILADNPLNEIPSGILTKAKIRCNSAKFESITDLLENSDFTDLKEISLFKDNFRHIFPDSEIGLDEFQTLMDLLYTHRCRISHARSVYTYEDLQFIIDATITIAIDLDLYGQNYVDFIKQLQKRDSVSENLVISVPQNDTFNEIPNNVPTADYNLDGGFIGRKEDLTRIIRILKNKQHRVITISGAGGVGKTALAQKIIEKIIEDNEFKFDGIVWVSAKESKLSSSGIEPVSPSIKDYDDLLETISDVMQLEIDENASIEDKEAHVNTIFEIYNNILLVVDNLETINDSNIFDFIIDSHKSLTIIITSRRGLGQVERRVELKQLKAKDAVHLFRVVAYEKNLSSLSRMDEETILKIVNKVACYPLAIKWLIGNVAHGKEINDIISQISSTSSDISKFCFEQIFNSLTQNCKNILFCITYFPEAVSSGILKYMTDLRQDDFEDSIHELLILSLIIQEQVKQKNGAVANYYSVLPLTRGYLISCLDENLPLRRELDEKFKSIQAFSIDAKKAKRTIANSFYDYGASTDEEKIAAMYSQYAFQKSLANAYEEGKGLFKKAIEIAPHLHTIYRSWAIVETTLCHYVEAEKLFKTAADISNSDQVTFHSWGILKKKCGYYDEATKLLKKALDLDKENMGTMSAYAHCLTIIGDYKKAEVEYERFFALLPSVKDTLTVDLILATTTSRADNLRRWAEQLIDGQEYGKAINLLNDAIDCFSYTNIHITLDEVAHNFRRKTYLDLANTYKKCSDFDSSLKMAMKALTKKPKNYRETEDSIAAIVIIAKLCLLQQQTKPCKQLFNDYFKNLSKSVNSALKNEYETVNKYTFNPPQRITGIIERTNSIKRYLIAHGTDLNHKATYLILFSDISTPKHPIDNSCIGKEISFIPILNTKTNKMSGKLALLD